MTFVTNKMLLFKYGLAFYIIFPRHMIFPLATKTERNLCCGEISCEMPATYIGSWHFTGNFPLARVFPRFPAFFNVNKRFVM